MARYTSITRPRKHDLNDEMDATFHVQRGYYQIPRDSDMRKHLEDWMVPVSAYPSGSWVPVWLFLLWELSETPAGWKRRVSEVRNDSRKIVSLLMSELLKRKNNGPPTLVNSIKACLAKHRRGTT